MGTEYRGILGNGRTTSTIRRVTDICCLRSARFTEISDMASIFFTRVIVGIEAHVRGGN